MSKYDERLEHDQQLELLERVADWASAKARNETIDQPKRVIYRTLSTMLNKAADLIRHVR